MAAATKVFYERGYATATVQDVADELGILKGSIYHYIETKEDLLYRLLAEVHDQVHAILVEVAARDDLEPLDKLSLYVRRQVDYNTRNLPEISIYYHDVDSLSRARRDDIFRRRREHEAFVTELIEQAQAEGKADPTLDARALTNLIFGVVIWIYRWYRPRGSMRREDLSETCARFVLGGVVGDARPGA